ncbi:MAG: class I SAM-dependent methyltransferase [Bacillota bacterium]
MSFDKKAASEYDSWYETKMGSFIDEVETKAAFDLFQPKSGEKVLDIGCGTGNFSIKLAKKGCEVTGIDISFPMLEQANKKAEKLNLDIDFKKGNALELDFNDNTFDSIFSMTAIEFIKELEKAFNEMKRVVKPGGKILLGTIRKNSDWGRLYKKQAQREDSVFSDAIFREPEDLENLDKDNLIKTKECLYISPDTPKEKINWDEEKRLADKKKGGFICTLWKIQK